MRHLIAFLRVVEFVFWASGLVFIEADFASHPSLGRSVLIILMIVSVVWATTDFVRASSRTAA